MFVLRLDLSKNESYRSDKLLTGEDDEILVWFYATCL